MTISNAQHTTTADYFYRAARESFSNLYWGKVEDSDGAFFEYLKYTSSQEVANQFLQRSVRKACQNVWSDSQDQEGLFQEMFSVLQRSDLSFYEKNQMFQTFTEFALSVYEELDENALVKTIEAFIKRSDLASDFQNRDWVTILNGMNGAIRDQILDDIFEALKTALKKSFKDEQMFNKVWEKMTDPLSLESRRDYALSTGPKDYLCGYCLNAFKVYQNPKSSDRLFLGKFFRKIDEEFLIKEMQTMLQCIQEENPEKIADDILDTLCCSSYFRWIETFA